MKKRILIVDDEVDVLNMLEPRLVAAGFEVLRSANGTSALERARRDAPALAIIDVMMPGLSGLEVCRTLKADPKTARLPVLLLSARTEEVDRVLGFEFGADDYVVKPFSPREVLLRVQALLRRQIAPPTATGTVLRNGAITIDRVALRVTVRNRDLELTRTEFKLLNALMENTGRVLSREALVNAVWPSTSDIDVRTVDTHMRRLREKLGAASRQVETIRGFGYRIDEAEE